MIDLRRMFKLFNTIAIIVLLPNLLSADTQSYSSYGTIGLIDMPTAASDSDGRLVLSQSGFDGDRRTSLTAQILPRISASFRYSAHGRNGNEAGNYYNHDRSFDIRFRAVDEGQYMPAFAIGLNDFETMLSMERDYFYPSIADREEPIVWQERGSLDHLNRAKTKAKELLKHYPEYLTKDIDNSIRESYPIIL